MRLILMCVFASTIRAGLPVSPLPLRGQAPAVLSLTRDLRIDAAEHDLSPITYLAVAPNGTIAFTQNQDGTIRFFSARGAPEGSFGRKGQGPGEFMNGGRLGWIGDTLVATDFATRRFTLIRPDRKLARTVPWATSVAMPGKSGVEAAPQRVSIARFLYANGFQLGSSIFAEAAPAPTWLGGGGHGTLFIRVDSAGAFQNLVGRGPSSTACSVVISPSGGGFEVARIPFCAVPLDDVGMDGARLALAYVEPGKSRDYRVEVYTATGATVFARDYPHRPKAIPRSVRDSVAATRARSGLPAMRASADRIPDTYPPLSRLLVGHDDTIWLELFSESGDRTWQALDARGNVVATAAIPRNTHILVASRVAIWAVETDEDGLNHIVRYRVTR